MMRRRDLLAVLSVLLLAACGGDPEPASEAELVLAESWPAETTLDDPAIPEASTVWLEMIEGATKSIDLAEFYGMTEEGSDLEAVLAALERAAGRGIVIRCLFDHRFYQNMPEVPDRLGRADGIEVRILDLGPLTGGVLHAKYFVVDRREAFLGSQNLDWRSLEHIAELGLRIRAGGSVEACSRIFEMDWALAAGQEPAVLGPIVATETIDYGPGQVTITPVASPRDLLPPGVEWELPRILAMIEGARERVRLQFLSYGIVNYDGSEFRDLDDALRAAAGRGVAVEMILADWCKDEKRIAHLQELQRLPNLTIRLVTIPEHSAGFIPYARVVHRKSITVDGQRSWLGTSNGSGDYFHKSRNVGLVVEGAAFATDLDRLFERVWESAYAETVDPEATYEEPRYRE